MQKKALAACNLELPMVISYTSRMRSIPLGDPPPHTHYANRVQKAYKYHLEHTLRGWDGHFKGSPNKKL